MDVHYVQCLYSCHYRCKKEQYSVLSYWTKYGYLNSDKVNDINRLYNIYYFVQSFKNGFCHIFVVKYINEPYSFLLNILIYYLVVSHFNKDFLLDGYKKSKNFYSVQRNYGPSNSVANWNFFFFIRHCRYNIFDFYLNQ